MIDERSEDGTGWAQFSDDRKLRYRLARALTELGRTWLAAGSLERPDRVVFVMLNPSTADAFKLDPTVRRCVQFAQRWGADVLEVVNLFALRSPYPEDLQTAITKHEDAGANFDNDVAIVSACKGATRVIVAWGNHGEIQHRAITVAIMLERHGVKLEALRLTPKTGVPMHPLARGKAYIPDSVEPIAWSP